MDVEPVNHVDRSYEVQRLLLNVKLETFNTMEVLLSRQSKAKAVAFVESEINRLNAKIQELDTKINE